MFLKTLKAMTTAQPDLQLGKLGALQTEATFTTSQFVVKNLTVTKPATTPSGLHLVWSSTSSEAYSTSTVNISAKLTMAQNIVSALVNTTDIGENHNHQIMLLVLICLFMGISLSISVAVIMFCRKKNSVFILQKSEQESEFELEDLNTEIDTSDTDDDICSTNTMKRSNTFPSSATTKYSTLCELTSTRLSQKKETDVNCSPSSVPLLKNSNSKPQTGSVLISDFETSTFQPRSCSSIRLTKSKTFSNPQESQKLLVTGKRRGRSKNSAKKNANCFGSLLLTKLEQTSGEPDQLSQDTTVVEFPSSHSSNSSCRQEDLSRQSSVPDREFCLASDEPFNFDGKLEIM